MSAARNRHFRTRRRRLKSRRICTRCATERAEEGHALCSACLAIKKAKRPEPKAVAADRRRLEALELARTRLLDRFNRVA